MKGLRPPQNDDEEGGHSVSRAETIRHAGAPREKRVRGLPETLAQGRFTIEKKLGEGSFGLVCLGWDTKIQQKVAIKLEHKRSSDQGQLGNEARLMDMFGRPVRRPGFAEVFHYGKDGPFAVLAMDLLGLSLEDSVQAAGGIFRPSTAAIAAEQAINLLSYVHSKSIVHRDIKTENFMWGIGNKVHHLYVIDFGLSSRYFLKKHVSMQGGKSLTGTARYASINAMKGYTQSRRDDLEALGHLLLYTLRGSLPWSGLDAPNYDLKLKLICEKKETLPLGELCKGYPKEFETFLHHSRTLAFDQRPAYDALAKAFRNFRETMDPPVQNIHELEWLEQSSIDPDLLAPLRTLEEPCPLQPEEQLVSSRSTTSAGQQAQGRG